MVIGLRPCQMKTRVKHIEDEDRAFEYTIAQASTIYTHDKYLPNVWVAPMELKSRVLQQRELCLFTSTDFYESLGSKKWLGNIDRSVSNMQQNSGGETPDCLVIIIP